MWSKQSFRMSYIIVIPGWWGLMLHYLAFTDNSSLRVSTFALHQLIQYYIHSYKSFWVWTNQRHYLYNIYFGMTHKISNPYTSMSFTFTSSSSCLSLKCTFSFEVVFRYKSNPNLFVPTTDIFWLTHFWFVKSIYILKY